MLTLGGIVKEDPNTVKRKRSPEAPSKIKERIHNSKSEMSMDIYR
jgi:hypothetical protein